MCPHSVFGLRMEVVPPRFEFAVALVGSPLNICKSNAGPVRKSTQHRENWVYAFMMQPIRIQEDLERHYVCLIVETNVFLK